MIQNKNLKIAIQKKGRLNKDSVDLLLKCGMKFISATNTLMARCENLPIDILFVRDDDIPTLVKDGICDLGIVGQNVLLEQVTSKDDANKFSQILELGFSKCRLSIAFPEEKTFTDVSCLQELSIATSYPNLLQQYLDKHSIRATILTISGSVEIAPRLGMADAICDLVATGRTLEENNLKEVSVISKSQATLIQSTKTLSNNKQEIVELLLRRISGVLQAMESKYILFHAPIQALNIISKLLPGSETPTVVPLEGIKDKVAVHLVSSEGVFWETLEKLKQAGASSILVLPIEKMLN
ncbi:MAG: ATP phosphoribosyltransferase [Thiotrichales bacterium]|nr:MAG: ATP phosphoribosyltransferase [Thiotrichales bacterium]